MISIQVVDEGVLAALQTLKSRLGDMSDVFDTIGMEMEARVSRRFEDETDPNGVAWASWAPITRNHYPPSGNARILDRFGDMLDGLSYQADEDGVAIGFDVPYAAFHEFGTSKMPRRGMLTADAESGTLGEGDQIAILDILGDYFTP